MHSSFIRELNRKSLELFVSSLAKETEIQFISVSQNAKSRSEAAPVTESLRRIVVLSLWNRSQRISPPLAIAFPQIPLAGQRITESEGGDSHGANGDHNSPSRVDNGWVRQPIDSAIRPASNPCHSMDRAHAAGSEPTVKTWGPEGASAVKKYLHLHHRVHMHCSVTQIQPAPKQVPNLLTRILLHACGRLPHDGRGMSRHDIFTPIAGSKL
jgi:hypothetical protein